MSESPQKLLRLKEVLKLIPVSRATWYAGCITGRFPQKVKLGPRIVAWRSEDIQKLIDEGWKI